MKSILSASLILIFFTLCSCSDENPEINDKWIQIDSIMPSPSDSEALDELFSYWNNCLEVNFLNYSDTILYCVNSSEDFHNVDSCSELPYIDFVKYTLTIIEIAIPVSGYKVSDVKFFANESKSQYKFDILIDTCTNCYTSPEVLYFYSLYPKLRNDYTYELFFKNIN